MSDQLDRSPSSSRRAALEEERDHLLQSLDDLEVEREVGDLDDEDYETLKDDYTVRAAEVLRSIERLDSRSGPVGEASAPAAGPGRRTGLWVGGLVVFAVAAGLFLAQAMGERGVNDQITGSISESPREQVLRCQQVGAQGDLLASLTCFDEVLERDPQNVEALTYRGWYLVLASGTAQQGGQVDSADELLVSGMLFLDRAVQIDPEFPDARAFRAIVFDRSDEPELACAELAVIAAGEPPPMIAELVAPLASRLSC